MPEITDIYLRDANFTGYKPEFIIREMFERGVFSFIPVVLLEMYAGGSFRKLPVSTQTTLIGELGLNAIQVVGIAESVTRSFIAARQTIETMFAHFYEGASFRECTFKILHNIASGAAPSRQPEFLCLMTAAHKSCPNAGRDSCLGCGFEIYTKSSMHLLVKEYIRLSSQKNGNTRRGIRIIETAIIPAMEEILSVMNMLYPDADDSIILSIVERGLNYVETSGKSNIE